MTQQPAHQETMNTQRTPGEFAQQLAFLVARRQQDEATVLAQAMREGVFALYREALVEAFLLGQISREQMVRELGADLTAQIEYQRDALKRDVDWGRQS
jgi:hypothetical protein